MRLRVSLLLLCSSIPAVTAPALTAQTSAASAGTAANPSLSSAPFRNPSLTAEARALDLVRRMTLEEKVSQLENDAAAIPRLGVPAYDWWSEGLHGIARSGYATVFPQAIGMAASWDAPLLQQVSTVISTEARAKNAEALRHDNHSIYFGLDIWSPNINIFRDPRWGRGQETYGEDPYLTSRMGVAFVRGLQGDDPRFYRTIATPKHFAVHSGPESTRHKADITPTPHDLEDTYLPAFRATITEAKAGSIMCAYNAVDGEAACANRKLLADKLRGDWGFKGYVTSDCGAVSDIAEGHKLSPDIEHAAVAALRAGTDTSCGTEFRQLTRAVHDGLIQESELETPLVRLFTARMQLGLFDPPAQVPYAQIPFSSDDSEPHRQLALKTAEESMVLLKNDGILPLGAGVRRLAVIGPNAASLVAIEGNYNAVPSRPVVPLQGIERVLGGRMKVFYAQGSPYVAELPIVVPRTVFHPAPGDTREGLTGEYFVSPELTGVPAATRLDQQIDFDWNAAAPVKQLDLRSFGVRWTGTVHVPLAGEYGFGYAFAQCYPCRDTESIHIWIDGQQVARETLQPSEGRGGASKPFIVHFADTAEHALKVEYTHQAPLFGAGIALTWQPDIQAEREQAVEAARNADAVVALVGLSPDLEGEEMPVKVEGFSGGDRTSIDLPKVQQDLLDAVAATGKPIIVVLLNGSAVAVPWAKAHAAAVLEAWYPGEEGGTAIARSLSGANNPGGRLPLTFYASTSQLPPFDDYSMKNRTYRYFSGEPLYPFGYGLSYTRFAYSRLKLSSTSLQAGQNLQVQVSVQNTGAVGGDEVAELYLIPPADAVSPHRELLGFARVHLGAGQAQQLSFTLDPRSLSVVDSNGVRAMRAGSYTLAVGGSQPQPEGLRAAFTVAGQQAVAK